MYDNNINPGKFHQYRGKIKAIYHGENTKYSLEDLEEEIHKDYENGKLSSNHYDNLMSLIQDINNF